MKDARLDGAPAGAPAVPRTSDAAALVAALVLVVLSAVLGVTRVPGGPEQVVAGDSTLPGVCVLRSWVGISCPGCGLTRSFISLGHLDWKSGFDHHPLGPVFFLFVLAQIPYRIAMLISPVARQRRPATIWTGRLVWGACGLLLATWAVRGFTS